MIRKRSTWLVIALAGAALLAGCGSSSSSSTSSTSSSQSSSTPASTGSTAAQTTSTPSGAGGVAVAAAVAACRRSVQTAAQVSSSVKAKVEAICDKAAHGDVAGAEKAGREVCAEVINASPIPAAAKEQALSACKSSK
jgi:hypothetical protein